MKKQTYIIVGILSLLALGWYTYNLNKERTANDVEKNVTLMEPLSGVEIVSESEVAYYPGAAGYYARPAAMGSYPGVIMIHENRGLRPEIKEAADALARAGYMVLAVDLLYGVAEDQDGARALTANFDQADGVANMRAGAAFLRSEGVSKLASLGWCFGGRQSVELAISGEPLAATVVYYGGNMATSTERLAPITWPVLGIFGDQDRAIPLTMVEDFRSSLNTLGVTNNIHIYPGVGHAFANPSGANYAPDATKDAWSKTLQFLNEHLSE